MEKVVNEAASAFGSYGYTYDGVLEYDYYLPTYMPGSLSRPSRGLITL